jgi:S-adenosylmethionine-diacylglycerol 3-amino-3-carboxypropyl transferase
MPQHVAERVDFSGVRYANCWEDADILCEALRPAPGSRVLSIASAGDNALALLAEGAEVVAVDLSPAQLACVELRRAAFAELEYEDVLRLLGVRECGDRLALFGRVEASLSPAARSYWRANRATVTAGATHGGKFERYFHLFRSYVLPLVHSRARVRELVESRPLDERREFYRRRWDTWRWRAVFKLFFSRFVMGRLGRDPEFFRHVEGSVGERILARARYALTELSPHDNPYLDFILFGGYRDALPRYLRPENYEPIRGNLLKLTLFHGTVEQAAKADAGGGFDGYNLSDIFEYLDPQQCEAVYRSLLGHSRTGARFAYWNMLAPRDRPAALADRVRPLEELAGRLFAEDRAFFYSRFVVEEAA